MPRLLRISEVLRNYAATHPMACIADWVHNYLAKAHPELGRKGPVCPFVPISLELDTIWMAEIPHNKPDLHAISDVILRYRDLFLESEPVSGADMLNKAFLVVFPNLGPEGASIVDEVQYHLKRHFVEKGMMLGEFHASNQSPGLRNPDFRPLRSPIPMLAMRYMVDSDLPFLAREDYPPELRTAYLRTYLARLGSDLSPAKFDEAMNAVIEAEIEKRLRQGKPLSNWYCSRCQASQEKQGVPA
ncbi:DUF6875 domain-containing protein [Massilia sp. W12]|uniref:DUF6875 domain-containing protein n=1 Tax=Massilia sp. W12 TaxID=3126507 RepID=UPI0030CE28E9